MDERIVRNRKNFALKKIGTNFWKNYLFYLSNDFIEQMILLNKLFYSTNNILEQLRFYWIIVEREKDEIDRKLMKRLEKEWTGWKKRDKNDNERNLYFLPIKKNIYKMCHEQGRNEIKKRSPVTLSGSTHINPLY